MKKTNITIIGAGAMGSAIARAVAGDTAHAGAWMLTVVDGNEHKLKALKASDGVVFVSTGYESLENADVVILAVKPQSFAELAVLIRPMLSKSALVISIMAGKSIATISIQLGTKRIVRAMPNLGAQFGQSMTVWTGKGLSGADKVVCGELFSLLGEHVPVANEDLVDKDTAVSASGVGFFAYIVEAYIAETVKLGFKQKDAEKIVLQTLLATNTILGKKDQTPAALRARVTSKGGTTEAGLGVLMSKQFSAILAKTFAQAYKRAKKLSN